MKRFKQILTIATAILSLVGCDESTTELDQVVTAKPEITKAEISGTIGRESVDIAIETTDADQICYTLYPTADVPSNEAKVWSEVDIKDNAATISITDLTAETQYKAEIYATKDDAKSLTVPVIFTTAEPETPIPTIKIENIPLEEAFSKAQLKVSVTDATSFFYTYYLEGERPEEPKMKGVEVTEGDGEYIVDITGIEVSVEQERTYTFEAYAENDEKQSENAYSSFTTAKSELLILKSQTINPLMATFDFDITEVACDGYAYDWGITQYFHDTFLLDNIESCSAQIITEDGELTLGATNYLKPAQSYTLVVAPIAYSSDGSSYSKVGDLITYEFTPPAIEIGTAKAIVEIEVDDSAKTRNSVSATLHAGDALSGTYYGCFEASKVIDNDVDAAVIDFFTNDYTYQSKFTKYDYSSSSYIPVESIEASFTYLESGSDYYIFTIAITSNGEIGAISTAIATTDGVKRDSSIKPNVEVTAGVTSMKATFDFNGCEKVLIYNQSNETGWYNDTSIENLFITDLSNTQMSYGHTLSDADGIFIFSDNSLVIDEEYTLYYMGVGANGAIGDLQKIEYQTTPPAYDSQATLRINQISATAAKDEGGSTYVDLALNVIMSGAESYIYSVVHKDYITDIANMKEWGDYALSSIDKQTSKERALTFKLQSRDMYIVLIAVDADGKYGTPQLFYPTIWQTIPEDEDDGGILL